MGKPIENAPLVKGASSETTPARNPGKRVVRPFQDYGTFSQRGPSRSQLLDNTQPEPDKEARRAASKYAPKR